MSTPRPDAYLAGLTMLARRELSTAKLREKLQQKGFSPSEVEAGVARLEATGALDDRRTAAALATRSAHVKLHGKFRAVRELQSHGIGRDLARQVVDEVYADVDEPTLLERALDKRVAGSIETPAELRRLYQYLVRHGFESAAARAAVMARATPSARDHQ